MFFPRSVTIPLFVLCFSISAAFGAANPTDADYQRHAAKLRQTYAAQGFTVVVEKPFVVIGDESPEMVRKRAENTIKWAVDHLKALYFTKDPNKILNIWLFKNQTSYYSNAKKIFGTTPSTPYGYYSSYNGALVMNISTGGGTLVHEIVHPFIESNFPDCPAWFNEGFASLYEQSGERDGRIVGLTNWRLAGLQQRIKAKTNPSFESLMATTRDEFYADETGVHYAQARYLCFYLQEKGLLQKFYAEFSKNANTDPTGLKTLKTVLGERDLSMFQDKWEEFVLNLSF
jgi:hypothetical protein